MNDTKTSALHRTARHARAFASTIACVAAVAACGSPEGAVESMDTDTPHAPETQTSEQALYPKTSTIWPTTRIPVCWVNPTAANAQGRAWSQAAVERAWEAVTAVEFEGWGACAPGAKGIRITVQDAQAKVRGLGKTIENFGNGMWLNFTFQNWCQLPEYTCALNLQRSIESIAVHEFGHALGFSHEQIRSDTPTWCKEPDGGSAGDLHVGAWDVSSVMNYCNPTYNNHGNLSSGDINGSQYLYGHLASGVRDYGGGFQELIVSKQGKIGVIGGLVRPTSHSSSFWTPGKLIAMLPRDKRPAKRHVFHLNQHNQDARVDVTADGEVLYVAGSSGYDWVSLAGIEFPTQIDGPLTLGSGVSNYGHGYEGGSYTRQGSTVHVSGLVRRSGGFSSGSVIATLPVGQRPSKIQIFNQNQHTAHARIDIHPNGNIVYVAGSTSLSWISLSGMSFSVAGATPVSLGSSIVDYGGAFGTAMSRREGDTIVVNGLIRSTSGALNGRVLATLPVGHRPPKTLIFTLNTHDTTARVDIHPNGNIYFNTGNTPYNWLSLSGIVFRVPR